MSDSKLSAVLNILLHHSGQYHFHHHLHHRNHKCHHHHHHHHHHYHHHHVFNILLHHSGQHQCHHHHPHHQLLSVTSNWCEEENTNISALWCIVVHCVELPPHHCRPIYRRICCTTATDQIFHTKTHLFIIITILPRPLVDRPTQLF